MPEEAFVASGFDVLNSEDGGNVVLQFTRDDGGTRMVTVPKQAIPQLLGALQASTGQGSVVPIDRSSLRSGADYQVQGYQFGRRKNGGAEITIHVELVGQGRVVTLTLDFPPEDVASLAKHLAG